MLDPLTPQLSSVSGGVTVDRDNLKLWIRELTHLSPQQIESVLAKQEQVALAVSSSK